MGQRAKQNGLKGRQSPRVELCSGAGAGVVQALDSLRELQQGFANDIDALRTVEAGDLLGMRSVRVLKEKLDQAFALGRGCEVDCSGAERVSAAGVQVLLAFFSAMQSAGHPSRLLKPTVELLSALEDLGLSANANEWQRESTL
jgi:ABC-type transporter Mla MlaB component